MESFAVALGNDSAVQNGLTAGSNTVASGLGILEDLFRVGRCHGGLGYKTHAGLSESGTTPGLHCDIGYW